MINEKEFKKKLIFFEKKSLNNKEIKYLIDLTYQDLNRTNKNVPEYYDLSIEEFIVDKDTDFPLEELIKLEDSNKLAKRYFQCLLELHKKRRKFYEILNTQEPPPKKQISIRGLLEYQNGKEDEIISNLVKRKHTYDIDNRSAQETGYLIETIFREALGGKAGHQKNSEVKRTLDNKKSRQVDCIIEKDGKSYAYEVKLRISMAASGQGRFNEELSFAQDCKNNEFIPILLILEKDDNSKFFKIKQTYQENDGFVFSGEEAWKHIIDMAPKEISFFINKYLYIPLIKMQ